MAGCLPRYDSVIISNHENYFDYNNTTDEHKTPELINWPPTSAWSCKFPKMEYMGASYTTRCRNPNHSPEVTEQTMKEILAWVSGVRPLYPYLFFIATWKCVPRKENYPLSKLIYNFFLSGSNRSIGQVSHHLCLFCHLDESGSQLRSVHGPIPFPFHGKSRSVIRVKLQ